MTAAELPVTAPAAEARWLTSERARQIGWGAFVIGSALRVVQLWLTARLGPDAVRFTLDIGAATFLAAIVLGTATSVAGAVIVARRPENLVGWLYVITGLLQGVVSLGLAYAALTLATAPDDIGVFFAWLNGVVDYAIPFSFAALVLLLFPDGRLPSRAWLGVAVLAIVGGLLRILEVGFGSGTVVLIDGMSNPYRASGPIGETLGTSARIGIGSVMVEAAFFLGALSLGVRYRRASPDGRRQIRWFLLAGVVAAISTIPLVYGTLVPGSLPAGFDPLALLFASLTLAPIATLIAITRYRLYEIDRIVNRAILYGSLTAILAGVFTAGIGLAQRLFVAMTNERSDAAIVLTTLVVATVYAPLRKRLETFVDRRFKFDQPMFGAYSDELTRALTLVEPRRAAERLIREAVTELDAIGGAILATNGSVTASHGTWPAAPTERIVIPRGSPSIAAVELGQRRDGMPHAATRVDELRRVAGLVVEATRERSPARP